MSIYANITAAKDMGLPREYAINARRAYLTRILLGLEDERGWLHLWVDENMHRVAYDSIGHADYKAEQLAGQIVGIKKELETIKRMTTDNHDRITDDMIERAKQTPIESLIEFRHKKATAWCHPDQRPSLCHMTRTNQAWCPVCDKYFDPIKTLITRDGMGFKDAVKSLC